MKKLVLIVLFFVCKPISFLAQTDPEDIVTDADKFQNYFYESLLQKSIENNDKAIVALEQCLSINSGEAAIYSELGRNYFALKDYQKAYDSFENATKIDPKNKWLWVGMYDVTFQTKDYKQAKAVLDKLIGFDEQYKEDLVTLHMKLLQYDQALVLISELNEKFGKSDRRESYSKQIMSGEKYQNVAVTNLLDKINSYPNEESNYLELIYLYSKNNEPDKVIEIATKLETALPNSEWAQVSLFKKYLDINDAPKAIKSMNIALASSKIDSKIKHRMLNEFLIFVNTNPQYIPDLDKAITYFEYDKDVDVAKEIGKFYQNKKQLDKAIKYYELSLKNNSDMDAVMLLLEAYAQTKQFDLLSKRSESMIELFPAQPEFYFYSGLANNQMQKFKKAIEMLEMGLDYVVNDLSLEVDFNVQLGEAYNGLGDVKKKEFYFAKSNQLLKEKK